jgi:hypothetical protein
MDLFAFIERREIHCVVRHQNETVLDGPPDDRPILARPHPEPGDVGRFVETPSPGKRHELGAQTFIDEELHEARGKSRSDSFSDETGPIFRQ